MKAPGYPQSSVTRYVNTLIDARLARIQVGPGHDIRARRPMEQLAIDDHHPMAWGIHIGARSTEIVIGGATGQVLRAQSIPLRIIEHSATNVLGRICQEMYKLARGLSQPVTVGVAFSGRVNSSGSVTSSVHGWDGVAAGEIITDVLSKPAFVVSGVSITAGLGLAHTSLDDNSLAATPQENESAPYFYAHEVTVHAWIFHGTVYWPYSGMASRTFSQITQSGTFEAKERTHPPGNGVMVDVARAQRILATNLAHLVEIAKCSSVTHRLLDERAGLLGHIVRLTTGIVDSTIMVFAGGAFTADPREVQLTAQQLCREAHGPSDLRIQRISQSIVWDTARAVATHQLWQDLFGILRAYTQPGCMRSMLTSFTRSEVSGVFLAYLLTIAIPTILAWIGTVWLVKKYDERIVYGHTVFVFIATLLICFCTLVWMLGDECNYSPWQVFYSGFTMVILTAAAMMRVPVPIPSLLPTWRTAIADYALCRSIIVDTNDATGSWGIGLVSLLLGLIAGVGAVV